MEGCMLQSQVAAVGFEPTPVRNGALSHRLRPLGQTVLVRPGLPMLTRIHRMLAYVRRDSTQGPRQRCHGTPKQGTTIMSISRISGLVVEYIVAIDVTRVRFPADAFARMVHTGSAAPALLCDES